VADFKTSGGKIRVFLDAVLMNRGKVDAVVFFAGIGQTFKDAFEHSVASRVAARTANA
jgi:acetate kinase